MIYLFVYAFIPWTVQGRIQEFAMGGRSFPFPSFPLCLSLSPLRLLPSPLEVWPLKPARGSGDRCEFPSWVRGRAPAENEFGAL